MKHVGVILNPADPKNNLQGIFFFQTISSYTVVIKITYHSCFVNVFYLCFNRPS